MTPSRSTSSAPAASPGQVAARPLRILILSDGRPGHYNLSEGIAAAIGRLGPTAITRLDVRRGRWPGPVLAALTRLPLPPSRALTAIFTLPPEAWPPADVVISAGAETLAASVWLARMRGIPNLHYGSLRQFAPTDFSVVMTSYARHAARPRHMLALKPSALDPDASGRPVAPITLAAPPARIALLIGGDAGTFTYRDDDWSRLLDLLPRAHRSLGVRWQVANSRRTPGPVGDRLAAMARDPANGIEQFVDVRAAGAGTLAALLGSVDAAICTDDSSSMMSECIWARLPVLGVTPAAFHHTRDESTYRAWLSAQGWCRSLPLAGLTPQDMLAALAALTPLAANPLDALVARLADAVSQLAALRAGT